MVNRPRRHAVILVVLGVTLCASVGLFAQPALAYEWNCGKFSGPNPTITYEKHSMGSAWSNAFDQGQYLWDVTSVPGHFEPAPSGDDDPMIDAYDGSYAEDWWAHNSGDCWTPGPDWVANEVEQKYNTRTSGSLTAANKKYVAVHELGHAYGLAHESMTCSSGAAVMETGEEKFSCSGSPPWNDDQYGVTDKY